MIKKVCCFRLDNGQGYWGLVSLALCSLYFQWMGKYMHAYLITFVALIFTCVRRFFLSNVINASHGRPWISQWIALAWLLPWVRYWYDFESRMHASATVAWFLPWFDWWAGLTRFPPPWVMPPTNDAAFILLNFYMMTIIGMNMYLSHLVLVRA